MAGDGADALQIHRCPGVAAGTRVPLADALALRFLFCTGVANDDCTGEARRSWLRQPVPSPPPGSQDPRVEAVHRRKCRFIAASAPVPKYSCFHGERPYLPPCGILRSHLGTSQATLVVPAQSRGDVR